MEINGQVTCNNVNTPISATTTSVHFAEDLRHLLALHQDLKARRAKISRGEQWLVNQIREYTHRCSQVAKTNSTLGKLWSDARAEILATYPTQE